MNRYQSGEKEVRETGPYGRVIGHDIAVSVGTAIPIEETLLTGTSVGDVLLLNIDTLARNYDNAYPKPDTVKEAEYIEDFLEEVGIIYHLLEPHYQVVLYTKKLTLLKKYFPYANIKAPTSEKQVREHHRITKLINVAKKSKQFEVTEVKLTLPREEAKNAVVLTHHPIDLLSRYHFKRLWLLQSHTGVIRKPVEWIKSLTNNKNYHYLPFNVLTMQILGDRSTLFNASKPSIKKPFLEIAEKGKWKPTTTLEKVKFDIQKLPENETKKMLKAMASVRLA